MKTVLIFIVILAFLQVIKPKIKGYYGEKRVSSRIKRLLNDNYRILDDIYIKTDRGTSQIDHIVVSIYGIFVIETKNYKG